MRFYFIVEFTAAMVRGTQPAASPKKVVSVSAKISQRITASKKGKHHGKFDNVYSGSVWWFGLKFKTGTVV
jgi:hypothetical protein